jgi:hypothetical protein
MQPLISDDELKRVFQFYLSNTQSMDVYGLKCAIFHLYGDKLSKADLGELIGDHLFLGLSLNAFISCCRIHEGNRFDGNRKIMQQCFSAIDAKEKGYINQHDVTQLLKKVAPHLGADHVFEMIDTLQLGKVTFTQFCAHYTAATGVKII